MNNCGCNNSNSNSYNNYNNNYNNINYDYMYNSNSQNMSNNSNISNNFSINRNPFPNNYLYGHAYTPNQILNKTFAPKVALQNGTIFPELVSPYVPGQSIDFINYLRNGGR